MHDNHKTKEALIQELNALRQQNARLVQAERRHHERLQELTHITASIPTIIWKADVDDHGALINTYISEIADELLGLPAHTIDHDWDTYFTFVEPSYMPAILQNLEAGISSPGTTISFDYEVRKANGETAWFSSTGRAYVKGGVTKVYGFTNDITKRKRAEKQVAESEKKYRASEENLRFVLESIPAAVFVHNLSGEFLIVNKTTVNYTGYTREELLAMTVADIDPTSISRDDRRRLWERLHHGASERVETTHIRKDGTAYPAEVHITAKKLHGKPVILVIVQDITDRKAAEQALRESEARFRAVFETAEDSIFIKDRALRYVAVNPAMERLFGLPASELIGRRDEELFGPAAGQHIAEIDNAVLAGEVIAEETTKPVLQQEFRTFHVIKVPMRDQDGQVMGLCGIARDMTDHKRAEQALQESERQLRKANATKDRFFSIIAHELRNPMEALKGQIQLLKEHIDHNAKAEARSAAQELHRSTQQVSDLLENLLTWALIQKDAMPYDPQTIALSTMTGPYYRDLWRMQADPKQITMTYEIEDSASIIADYRMVETILRNLIANAIHFTPHGGEIRIKAQKRDDVVEVAVIDNGIGMSADQARNLFDQERATGPGRDIDGHQGTGLGLILCQDFVARHGGKIWVESQPGLGSAFRFQLPTPHNINKNPGTA